MPEDAMRPPHTRLPMGSILLFRTWRTASAPPVKQERRPAPGTTPAARPAPFCESLSATHCLLRRCDSIELDQSVTANDANSVICVRGQRAEMCTSSTDATVRKQTCRGACVAVRAGGAKRVLCLYLMVAGVMRKPNGGCR